MAVAAPLRPTIVVRLIVSTIGIAIVLLRAVVLLIIVVVTAISTLLVRGLLLVAIALPQLLVTPIVLCAGKCAGKDGCCDKGSGNELFHLMCRAAYLVLCAAAHHRSQRRCQIDFKTVMRLLRTFGSTEISENIGSSNPLIPDTCTPGLWLYMKKCCESLRFVYESLRIASFDVAIASDCA